ncbi:MAG TPA: glycosyltransferase [Candidatus Dormibacteraeota bacterium]|nr:glycosyltransferase [Candidatus Dormibacteraeota bacterium]
MLDNAGVDIGGRPVVNLIQGFSHTTPGDPRYEYLSRPALRICVSPQLATALADTGRVNGPIVTIENGLDLDALRAARTNAHFAVAIAGLKNAPLALEIEARLQECGIETIAQTQGLPHDAFLALLASASVAVVLPHETEGFFLPALEAMVLGCAVVAPDCIGNRSFCVDHRTALVPEYSADAIVQAISLLLSDALVTRRILAGAAAIVERYSLSGERDKFYRALDIFLDAP